MNIEEITNLVKEAVAKVVSAGATIVIAALPLGLIAILKSFNIALPESTAATALEVLMSVLASYGIWTKGFVPIIENNLMSKSTAVKNSKSSFELM